jgi:hypothetical protein
MQIVLTILVSGLSIGTPATSIVSAANDLAKYGADDDKTHIRYLSRPPGASVEEWEDLKVALSVHVNSVSRAATLAKPVLVKGDLLRVDIRDYKWKAATWEKLASVEPYYTVRRKIGDKEEVLAARWLPKNEITKLIGWTDSIIPVVRADWFWVQTVVQADRKAGYYDFLGLKNRNDYFKLIGSDKKKAEELNKQWAAVLRRSGIATRNRQVMREGVVDAGHWFTLDVTANQTRKKNAINTLLGYDHDAEEHIAPLPNGLFAYYLSDNKGAQQDSAPDQVGPDTTTTSNDARIHSYLSCVRCHREGLRPLDDYGRRLLSGQGKLAVSNDRALFDRLATLYLRPLERHRVRDNLEYSEALKEVGGNGLTPGKLSQTYTSVWQRWNDNDVTREQAALEIGVDEALLVDALRWYGSPAGGKQILPLSLLGFTLNKPEDMLREHFEEAYDTIQLILDLYKSRKR